MIVYVNLDDVDTMLRRRGLEPNGRVQRLFTTTCAKEMDQYVPFQGGYLKNSRIIKADSITYRGPYARFHYYGKLMIGVKSGSPWAKLGERKIVTSRDLKYHGGPKRGANWFNRMWADKKLKIINDIAKAAGGRPG